MTLPSPELAASVLDTHPSEEAYAKLLPQIEAKDEASLAVINVDIVSLVTSMVGALPEIRAMRPALESTFVDFDLKRFDQFETYLMALNHANALYRISRAEQRDASELVETVTRTRSLLLTAVQALAAFGLVDATPLASMGGRRSHRELAGDVLALVTLLKAQWDNIEDKVPLSARELNAAARDAFDLQRALGLSEQAPALRHEAAVRRRQAYTLFREVYDPLRRAALYLYGEEGASDIVPKLTVGRSGRQEAPSEAALVAEFDPPDEPALPTAARSVSERVPAGTALLVDNPQSLPLTSVFDDAGGT